MPPVILDFLGASHITMANIMLTERAHQSCSQSLFPESYTWIGLILDRPRVREKRLNLSSVRLLLENASDGTNFD